MRHKYIHTAISQELSHGPSPPLTCLADCKGALVAPVDLRGASAREVEELDQTWHHLVLLLCVPQSPIPSEPPGEHSLLRVQDQLKRDRPGTQQIAATNWVVS